MKAVFLLDADNYKIIYSEECIKKIGLGQRYPPKTWRLR